MTRVWTYQELVNSRSVCFIVEKGSDVSVSGDQFLNFVGQAINEYKKAKGYDSFSEAKRDYSFIYSTAPRSEILGRCWRPITDSREPLHPILAWSSDGERQSGCIYPTHLQLNNMCRMTFSSISQSARQYIEEWLQSDNAVSLSDAITTCIFRRLKNAGFSGGEKPLELESGYFFPQSTITDLDKVFVVVATEVRWVHGAPGLLVRDNGTDIYHYCGVGVFVI